MNREPRDDTHLHAHPLTAILKEDRLIYSARARDLIREIAAFADEVTRKELGIVLMGRYNPDLHPDIDKLEHYLEAFRDRYVQNDDRSA